MPTQRQGERSRMAGRVRTDADDAQRDAVAFTGEQEEASVGCEPEHVLDPAIELGCEGECACVVADGDLVGVGVETRRVGGRTMRFATSPARVPRW